MIWKCRLVHGKSRVIYCSTRKNDRYAYIIRDDISGTSEKRYLLLWITGTLRSTEPEINYYRSLWNFQRSFDRSKERERERETSKNSGLNDSCVHSYVESKNSRASYKPAHVTLYGCRDASNYVTIPRRYSTIKSSSNYAKCSAHTSSYNGCPIIFSRSSFEYRLTRKFLFVLFRSSSDGKNSSNCNFYLFCSFLRGKSITREKDTENDVTWHFRHTLEGWNRFKIQEEKQVDESPIEGKSLDDKNHLPRMGRANERTDWRWSIHWIENYRQLG